MRLLIATICDSKSFMLLVVLLETVQRCHKARCPLHAGLRLRRSRQVCRPLSVGDLKRYTSKSAAPGGHSSEA